MKRLISRITMVNVGPASIEPDPLYIYVDCYGEFWVAKLNFLPWNKRIKYEW